MQFRGRVSRKPYAVGSKSAQLAVSLVTGQGTFQRRRVGGNSFFDPELEPLVGTEIVGEGKMHREVLLMDEWHAAGSNAD